MFEGKVVLVTGGASGIGRAAVERFLAQGASVAVADVSGGAPDGAHAVRCDVSDAAQVEAAVAEAVERFGGLDVMVNNAGIEQMGPLVEVDPAEAARVVGINLLGTFHGIRFAAPRIAERGGGAIVSTASATGLGGSPATGVY